MKKIKKIFVFFKVNFHNDGRPRQKTLPEAQRTQAIESKTLEVSENSAKMVQGSLPNLGPIKTRQNTGWRCLLCKLYRIQLLVVLGSFEIVPVLLM